MRELVVTENITLDGVIDASEGWFAPSGGDAEIDTADLAAVQREQREGADAVLLGRLTYEEFAAYWPKQTDDTTGVTDYLNRTEKYVVSATLTEPGWENTTVLAGDAMLDEVRRVKALPGKDIVATGSTRLVTALVRSGLVDEYRLFVYPVLLGRGTRLFADANGPRHLRLVETRAFDSGIALLRYRAAP
jgi:dihydrofolate reductase